MLGWKTRVSLLFLLSCLPATVHAGLDPCVAPIRNTATRFWVPLIGHGTDPFGNRFDTIFKIINLQETAAHFSISSCDDSGATVALLGGDAGPVSKLDVTVPGRGTRTLQSLNAEPEDSLSVGWARVDTTSAIGVEVIFNIRDPDGFLTSTNVRVGLLLQQTSFFAEIGPQVNTGVAFMYPPEENAPERIDIDLFLRDQRGVQVAQTSLALNKGQKTSRFLGELLTPSGGSSKPILKGSSAAFSGSVDVQIRTSDPNVRLAILPLRQEGLVLTSQVLFPGRTTTAVATTRARDLTWPVGANLCQSQPPEGRVFYIPLIGHGTDAFGNGFDSVVQLINLGNQPASARIVACDDSGQMADLLSSNMGGVTSLIDFGVDALGTVTLRSLNSAPGTNLDVGWAVITTVDPIGVEVIFNLRDRQGFFTSTNVPLFPIITATAFFAEIGQSVNTGAAFLYPNFNDSDEQRVAVDLFLIDADGTTVAQTSLGLNKGERTSRFLGELLTPAAWSGFPLGVTENFSGTLEIRASNPVAILPLRQEGLVLTTQALFPPRVIRPAGQ